MKTKCTRMQIELIPLAILWVVTTTSAATIQVPEDYPTIAEAVAVAMPGDVVLVQSSIFVQEPLIDFAGKPIRIESTDNIDQEQHGAYLLAADAELAAPSGSLVIRGDLQSPAVQLGTATVFAQQLALDDGRLLVQPNARLHLVSNNEAYLHGSVIVEHGGVLRCSNSYGGINHHGNIMLHGGAHLIAMERLTSNGMLTSIGGDVSVGTDLEVDGEWYLFDSVVTIGTEMSIDYEELFILYGGQLMFGNDLQNLGTLELFDALIVGGHCRNGPSQYEQHDVHLALDGTTIIADELTNHEYCALIGSGDWNFDLQNDGAATITADTTLTGDTFNTPTGIITIQAGTLTFFGSLDNQGTIIGDYVPPLADDGEGQTIRIAGDLVMGNVAGLHLPEVDATLRVDGHYDLATTNADEYSMQAATLRLGTLAGSHVQCEVMSRDLGANLNGLLPHEPGRFPLGTLRIAGGTVTLVDTHDNDGFGQEACEAVYVDTLQIDGAATLITNGCHVYYRTLQDEGTVSDPADLIELPAWVVGDSNCDGTVSFDDIQPFVKALSGQDEYEQAFPDCEWLNADCDGDGLVTFDDIAAFVSLLD